MSLAALVERLRTGELSPREAVEHYLARIEARRELNAYISVRGRGGPGRGGGAPGVIGAAGAALGSAGRGQGRDRRGRDTDDGGVGDPPRERGDAGRRGRRAAEGGGRDHSRQAEPARVRLRRPDHEPALRPGAEPVVDGPDLRRVERRERGGRGRRARGRHARHRHRRLDPHPGCVLRRHRPPAVDRARLERGRRACRVVVRRRRPDRAQRRGLRPAARGDRRLPRRAGRRLRRGSAS